MTRLMFDAVTVANLPEGGDLYAGYIDGRYANVDAMQARFPDKRVVRIAVFAGTPGGEVYDVENGDLTPDQVPGVLKRERAAGRYPTMYVNLSNWQACRDACAANGLTEPPWWVAHYTQQAHLESGSVATQYGDPGPYDASLVEDFWPGIDPPQVPKPTFTETITGDPDVATIVHFQCATGPDGNGYKDLPGVDANKIISVMVNGSDPAAPGHSYHKVDLPQPLNVDGVARIPLVTDVPNGLIDARAFVSA